MPTIFVNHTREENEVIHGIAVWEHTVKKDLEIMYSGKGFTLKNIEFLKQNPPHPDGFHFISRYFQFVVLYQYNTTTGSSLQFSDYQNDLDKALEEYTLLLKMGWREEDRNNIMKIFQEIENDPKKEIATMIVEDEMPDEG